jgi:hypothetical protein
MQAFIGDLIRRGHYPSGHVNRTYRPNTWPQPHQSNGPDGRLLPEISGSVDFSD